MSEHEEAARVNERIIDNYIHIYVIIIIIRAIFYSLGWSWLF